MTSAVVIKPLPPNALDRAIVIINFVRRFQSFIADTVGWWMDGWMDELGFYVPSTVFQSFRDDGRVNMKGSVQ